MASLVALGLPTARRQGVEVRLWVAVAFEAIPRPSQTEGATTIITPEQREQLKAFATGDIDRAQELSDAMPDRDWGDYRLLHAALFAVLLDDYFRGGASPQAIAEFVARIRRDYKAADISFNSWTVEGVLRATTGEEHLFEHFSSEDVLSTQAIVVGRLTSYDPNISSNIDAFLDDAEALVAKWERGNR